MSEPIRTPEGTLVTLSPEGEILPVTAGPTFDQILLERGAIPNREVRTTYSTETEEGREMLLRHMQAQTDRGVKNNFLNQEFVLIGATSWPVRTTKDADGKELSSPKLLIRTVLETDQGELIPSASAYVYESLMMIQQYYGKITQQNPVKVKIVKAGQADKLIAVAAMRRGPSIADKSKAGRPKA